MKTAEVLNQNVTVLKISSNQKILKGCGIKERRWVILGLGLRRLQDLEVKPHRLFCRPNGPPFFFTKSRQHIAQCSMITDCLCLRQTWI